jgi:hypothetical protein
MNLYTQGSSESGYITYMAIVSGETVALDMTLSNGGTPINLTSYILKAQINFETPLSLTTANGGITIVNAAQGQIRLNITSAQTASIEQGVFDYDLWMTSAGGVQTPLLTGKFSVSPNVTAIP